MLICSLSSEKFISRCHYVCSSYGRKIVSFWTVTSSVKTCLESLIFIFWSPTVWTLQRNPAVLEDWSTTVKPATAKQSFTPSMEPLIWSWWLPETSTQKKSCCMTTAIGAKPQSRLTLGSNTEPTAAGAHISNESVLSAVLFIFM